MAQIKRPLHSEDEVQKGEKRLVEFLKGYLPEDYYLIPNGEYSFKNPQGMVQYYECDCIVVAPHAIYHIENKDWGGQLTGDDNAWFVGSSERKNPHKTATFKSKIIASKLQLHDADWRRCRVVTLVTLSNPNQSKFGLDPHCDCYDQTFLLNSDLIDFLQDADKVKKAEDAIADIQEAVVDYLVGTTSQRTYQQKTQLLGKYAIDEVLQSTEDFVEYLCHPKILKDKLYKIVEYPLDNGGGPLKLRELRNKLQNGYLAQEKITTSPYIIKCNYNFNEEETYFYEISEYMDSCTLKACLRQKTFTLVEKLKIIVDIAHALKTAHSARVVHRNVTPESIYLLGDGNAALANFSRSWFCEHSNSEDGTYTVSSMLIDETSPYYPPEFKDKFVGECSDLFSLGVIAYELLVGHLPFDSVLTFRLQGGILSNEILPTKQISDLPEWIDELVQKLVVADVNERWETADEVIDFITSHAYRATENGGAVITSQEPSEKNLKDLKPGDKVTQSLVLYEELGKGGFGRVFKAKNTIIGDYYAVKLFDRNASAIEDTRNEFNALKQINHPNVVRIWNCDLSLDGLFYTQMELLEGDNLSDYTKGDMKLPLSEIYKMAEQILSALVYMQELNPALYHRDIKPNNIVWDKGKRYVLIDFNISTSTEDNSFAGTLPYMAPDLVQSSKRIDWDCSADTFSLGVTLYELLTHVYPWPGSDPCPNLRQPATDIRSNSTMDFSDGFVDFIMKSIITDRNQRFRNAKEMLEALQAIGPNGMLKDTTSVSFIQVYPQTTTDIVDYVNSLYSQSEHGNSGTRSAIVQSALDELTYTKTKLDNKLIGDIAALKYKLVIITGNAGDGKTAFLHQIESLDPKRLHLTNKNGSKFSIKGVPFESNYDGSQDEEEKANDEVLNSFFEPFMNLSNYNDATQGRIIAINEGRLVDFLSTQEGLKNLHDNIEEYFYNEGHAELIPGLMVINLNLRSVTARDENGESLLHSQIKKLTDASLWSKCKGCPIKDKCFINYNVSTFQDSSASNEVINRLEWLIRTIVYKRELHITMRDLRSFIAFMLTRDYSCEQVKQMVEHIKADDYEPEFYWQFYYFNITAPAFYAVGKHFPFPGNESNDRIIRMLKDTDIARVALPSLDRDLYYKEKVEEDYIPFDERKEALSVLLKEFNKQNVLIPTYEMEENYTFLLKHRHQSFIRHQYFEGKFAFKSRLPYQSLEAFNDRLTEKVDPKAEDPKVNIAKAISRSEGCLNDELCKKYLLLACSHINDPLSKSYRMFNIEDFELFVNKTPHLTEYIEYESDSLTFRHKEDKDIKLTVSLDLFEMLDYIGKGFSPSINDLQGRFIELQIFKNRLESKTYNEILVTKNNKKFFVIKRNSDRTLSIEQFKLQES